MSDHQEYMYQDLDTESSINKLNPDHDNSIQKLLTNNNQFKQNYINALTTNLYGKYNFYSNDLDDLNKKIQRTQYDLITYVCSIGKDFRYLQYCYQHIRSGINIYFGIDLQYGKILIIPSLDYYLDKVGRDGVKLTLSDFLIGTASSVKVTGNRILQTPAGEILYNGIEDYLKNLKNPIIRPELFSKTSEDQGGKTIYVLREENEYVSNLNTFFEHFEDKTNFTNKSFLKPLIQNDNTKMYFTNENSDDELIRMGEYDVLCNYLNFPRNRKYVKVENDDAIVKIFYSLLDERKKKINLRNQIYDRLNELKSVDNQKIQINELIESLNTFNREVTGIARVNVKNEVYDFVKLFIKSPTYFQNRYLNISLTGGAGTGKTTIAIYLGKLLSKLGVLFTDNFFMHSKSTLVGEHVGETAIKTKSKLVEATEGVMFIDEAYAIAQGSDENHKFDQFGLESINEFINFMDKNKGRIVIITAGYAKEIEEYWFGPNEGMKRRMPYKWKLEDYTLTDLGRIIKSFYRKELKGAGDVLPSNFRDLFSNNLICNDNMKQNVLFNLLKDSCDIVEYKGSNYPRLKNQSGDLENIVSFITSYYIVHGTIDKNKLNEIFNSAFLNVNGDAIISYRDKRLENLFKSFLKEFCEQSERESQTVQSNESQNVQSNESQNVQSNESNDYFTNMTPTTNVNSTASVNYSPSSADSTEQLYDTTNQQNTTNQQLSPYDFTLELKDIKNLKTAFTNTGELKSTTDPVRLIKLLIKPQRATGKSVKKKFDFFLDALISNSKIDTNMQNFDFNVVKFFVQFALYITNSIGEQNVSNPTILYMFFNILFNEIMFMIQGKKTYNYQRNFFIGFDDGDSGKIGAGRLCTQDQFAGASKKFIGYLHRTLLYIATLSKKDIEEWTRALNKYGNSVITIFYFIKNSITYHFKRGIVSQYIRIPTGVLDAEKFRENIIWYYYYLSRKAIDQIFDKENVLKEDVGVMVIPGIFVSKKIRQNYKNVKDPFPYPTQNEDPSGTLNNNIGWYEDKQLEFIEIFGWPNTTNNSNDSNTATAVNPNPYHQKTLTPLENYPTSLIHIPRSNVNTPISHEVENSTTNQRSHNRLQTIESMSEEDENNREDEELTNITKNSTPFGRLRRSYVKNIIKRNKHLLRSNPEQRRQALQLYLISLHDTKHF